MKFLITEFTGLGNFIQKTPIIRSIHKIVKEAEVYLIGDNRWGGLDVIRGSDWIREIFEVTLSRDKRNILTWINEREIDAILDPPGSFTPYWVFRLFCRSNAKKIVKGIDIRSLRSSNARSLIKQWKRFIVSPRKVEYVPIIKGRHEIDSNYDAVEALFNKPIERSYQTWVSLKRDDKILRRFNVKPKKYVCLQPGAANGNPTPKTWHPENFLHLAGEIRRCYPNHKVLLIGDQGDSEKIINKLNWPYFVQNTAGKTNIPELMNLLANAGCVVAHDSGVMHLANALDVSLIALYGPTDFSWTGPKGKNTRVLFSKTEAFGIMYKREKSERQLVEEYPNHAAMSGITVDEVIGILEGMLKNE